METNHYVYKRVQNCVYLSQKHKKEMLSLLRDPRWRYIEFKNDNQILKNYNDLNATEHIHIVSIPLSFYLSDRLNFDTSLECIKNCWGSNTKARYAAHCATIKAFKKEERKMKPKTRIEEIANWGVVISIVGFVTYLIYQAF